MREEMLDRPVWWSLAARQEALSVGGDLARRYRPDVNLFAAARDDSPEALEALADLTSADEDTFLFQIGDYPEFPDSVSVETKPLGVQLVGACCFATDLPSSDDVIDLTAADAQEMLDLATLTKPGPFFLNTYQMGAFIGVRIDGRLAAMAGERFCLPGYTEVSGVCVHPDFQRRGLGRRLSHIAAARIEARGDLPIIHAWKTNDVAISLYEDLGFKHRSDVQICALRRR